MMNPLLAATTFAGYDLVQVAIFIVVVAAIIGLVMLALRHFQIPVPAIVWQAAWIVLGCFIIIVCIKLVASM